MKLLPMNLGKTKKLFTLYFYNSKSTKKIRSIKLKAIENKDKVHS